MWDTDKQSCFSYKRFPYKNANSWRHINTFIVCFQRRAVWCPSDKQFNFQMHDEDQVRRRESHNELSHENYSIDQRLGNGQISAEYEIGSYQVRRQFDQQYVSKQAKIIFKKSETRKMLDF